MSGRRRGALALLLWGLVIVLAGSLVGAGDTAGQGLNHADLIIEFPDGHTERLCVEFAEDEISGDELLRRSGLSVVFSGFGGLGSGVCRIGDVGCSDPGDCFCQCRGGDCEYWAYYGLDEGEWRFQPVGPSARTLRDGDVDAWVWGSGSTPPGAIAEGQPCPEAVATQRPPPSATARPGEPETTPVRPAAATEPPSRNTPAGSARDGEPLRAGEPPGVVRPAVVNGEADSPARTPTTTAPERVSRLDSDVAAEDVLATPDAAPANAGEEQSDRSVPAGLIAFGALAAVLAATGGAVFMRRRTRG